MKLWEIKQNDGSYKTMKTPSAYKIDWEDIDNKSYRSVTTFNLIRTSFTKKWFKGQFTFNYLTEQELEEILNEINKYPLTVRITSPLFGSDGKLEFKGYVSKVSVQMQKNNENYEKTTWHTLSFNLTQSVRVVGQ